ncbi:MAG: DUF2764 family protein [Candidatus Omnitrophota bacterium]
MLNFGNKPPFSFETFRGLCSGIISDEDISILKITSNESGYIYDGDQPALKKWNKFDMALRNELVKIRAGRKHVDPHKYIRKDDYFEPEITRIAANASRNTSILEAEKMLDLARWQALEDMAIGHYFDLDFLVVYALKLLILEKWNKINTADKARVLEEVLTKTNN